MTALSKGQNARCRHRRRPVRRDRHRCRRVRPAGHPSGKVRTDNDFVFFNQPTGPGVRLVPGAGLAQLHINTGQVLAEIDAIRAVITLDDASSSFGGSPRPPPASAIPPDARLYSYTIGELSSESVVIALESTAAIPTGRYGPSDRATRADSPTWSAITG